MKNKDLSPVRSAAKQLAGLLPRPELPEGEMWQFFHFQTNDYCTVERTVRLACEQNGTASFCICGGVLRLGFRRGRKEKKRG